MTLDSAIPPGVLDELAGAIDAVVVRSVDLSG